MTSGLKYGKEGTFLAMITKTYYNPSLRAVAMSSAIEEQPSKTFYYNKYDFLLLGIILERVTGVCQWRSIWKKNYGSR
jgi:CubicO group peptidase (beta-lactamase class C family)